MALGPYIGLYLISIPVFVICDLLWLGFFMKDFYQLRLEGLLGEVNWTAAIVFYLIFLSGVTFFATAPAYFEGSLVRALILGALFGFFTYATYDLTNHATLRDWPLAVTIVDIVWGTILGALVSGTAFSIYTYFFG